MNCLSCYPPYSALTYPNSGRHHSPKETLELNRAHPKDVLVCKLGFHHQRSWRKLVYWLIREETVLLLIRTLQAPGGEVWVLAPGRKLECIN